jgi:hypothetical protein
MKIILPKAYIDHTQANPLFFLAGPVLGGGDWQRKCAIKINTIVDEPCIVIPCRYSEYDPMKLLVPERYTCSYLSQTCWERKYLELAGDRRCGVKNGCILFWLPCESKSQPRIDGNPYGRDTYGELGEWRGRMMDHPDHRIVIGAEDGFPGLKQITRNYSEALNKKFPIYKTLDETIDAAIGIAT